MSNTPKLDALFSAMASGVTFGGLRVGERFRFPAQTEPIYVKTSPRRFRFVDAPKLKAITFTTGAETAVVVVE